MSDLDPSQPRALVLHREHCPASAALKQCAHARTITTLCAFRNRRGYSMRVVKTLMRRRVAGTNAGKSQWRLAKK